jgi:hypothetical protein
MEPSHLHNVSYSMLDRSSSHSPHAVIQPRVDSAKLGMRHLAHIAWRTDGTETHSEPEDKATPNEHLNIMCGCLDACPEYNQESTSKHTHASAKIVVNWACKRNRGHRANVVDCHDESDLRSCGSSVMKSDTVVNYEGRYVLACETHFDKIPWR